MPTHKPDLSALSITQLSELTGVSEKTVSKRLREKGTQPIREDGKTLWFAPVQALPTILRADVEDPFAEKKRLDGARADLAELELAQLEGEIAPVADLEFALTSLLSGVRTRFLALPAKVAADVAASGSPAVCHEIVERAVHEVLEAIADVSVAHLRAGDTPSGSGSADRKRRRRS